MSTLPALVLTPAARAWLAQTTTAHVLNGFDRACNLVNAHGEVLAVVTSERGLTPFAVVVAASERSPFRVVTETSQVRVQPGSLQVGPYDIDLTAARLWDPVPDWPAIRSLFSDTVRLDQLAALAAGHGPAGCLLELFEPAGLGPALPPVLSSRVRQGALDLVAGLRSGSTETAVAGAARLAGLGGGLTPAGDDFVLGVLLAAWAGLYGAGAECQALPIAEAAAPRTTTLSAAYLRGAARGECSAYWHSLFAALLKTDGVELRQALATLLAVGHTSGADALAGFLAGRLPAPGLAHGPQITTTNGG